MLEYDTGVRLEREQEVQRVANAGHSFRKCFFSLLRHTRGIVTQPL